MSKELRRHRKNCPALQAWDIPGACNCDYPRASRLKSILWLYLYLLCGIAGMLGGMLAKRLRARRRNEDDRSHTVPTRRSARDYVHRYGDN